MHVHLKTQLIASVLLTLSTILPGSCFAAAAPPPDKLVPASALVMVTVPDVKKALQATEANPSMLWLKDPAMKPLVTKFLAKWQAQVVEPLQKQFGIQFSNYTAIAEGQWTVAWFPPSGESKASDLASIPFVMALDSGSHSDVLKKHLEELRKKWVDSGKPLKTDKIRGVEFASFRFGQADLDKAVNTAFPNRAKDDEPAEKPAAAKPADGAEAPMFEWWLGQSDSLLLLGNSSANLEKLLALQAGAGGQGLGEEPNFAPWRSSLFEGADYYAWMNLQAVIDMVKKMTQVAEAGARKPGMAMPTTSAILEGLGVGAMKAVAYSSRSGSDGGHGEIRLAIPEGARQGLVKMFAFPAKDAAPPAFVPDDALKFSRTRIDLKKTFEVLEETIIKVFPASGSLIKMLMETAGKEKDPTFDLRKSLIGNLGDDYVSYSKSPREKKLENLSSSPSIQLIAAPNAEQLASAIKTLTAFLPTQGGKKDREVLGRKVYTIAMQDSESTISYTASGGYLVVAEDDAMLEEYLRSSDQKAKSLKDHPGLAADAEKVGGMATGMFGYVNGLETARLQFEVVKKEAGSIANLIASVPIASRLGLDDDAKAFSEWLDPALLPPFDQVAKYFHHTVYAGEFTPQGLQVKIYTPRPPALRK